MALHCTVETLSDELKGLALHSLMTNLTEFVTQKDDALFADVQSGVSFRLTRPCRERAPISHELCQLGANLGRAQDIVSFEHTSQSEWSFSRHPCRRMVVPLTAVRANDDGVPRLLLGASIPSNKTRG
jgi:hypothetical protein